MEEKLMNTDDLETQTLQWQFLTGTQNMLSRNKEKESKKQAWQYAGKL